MKIIIFLLSSILLLPSLAFSATQKCLMPKFESSIHSISTNTQKMMQKESMWKSSCPLSLSDLVEVKLTYWGFDHKAHEGSLIVNKALSTEIVSIFKAIYYHQFPIQRMVPVEEFKENDNAMMEENTTIAFNCRDVTGHPGIFSQHSYGRAIDINPLINPYVKGEEVLPPSGKQYRDRTKNYPGKIIKNSFIYNEFIKHGWDWGGNWYDIQDYQHFEKRANHEKRNPYGYS